jgi:hypothetical protein
MISSLILILPLEVIIVLLELDHLLLSEVGSVVTTILSRRTSVVVSCIGSTTSPEASLDRFPSLFGEQYSPVHGNDYCLLPWEQVSLLTTLFLVPVLCLEQHRYLYPLIFAVN